MDHYSPIIEIGGLYFDLPTCIMVVVTSLIVFFLVKYMTSRITSDVPSGKQNLLEWVIDFVKGIAEQFMDRKSANRFVPLAVTIILYIFISNVLELFFMISTTFEEPVPFLGIDEELLAEHHGEVHVTWWKSPTVSPSVTFSLAFVVLLYSHYVGLKKSPKQYAKHMMNPIHLLEEFITKPLTLPLRLFGNIFAGEILILVIMGMGYFAAAIPLAVWLGYSVFVAAVQAYIFTTLALVYISQMIEEH